MVMRGLVRARLACARQRTASNDESEAGSTGQADTRALALRALHCLAATGAAGDGVEWPTAVPLEELLDVQSQVAAPGSAASSASSSRRGRAEAHGSLLLWSPLAPRSGRRRLLDQLHQFRVGAALLRPVQRRLSRVVTRKAIAS